MTQFPRKARIHRSRKQQRVPPQQSQETSVDVESDPRMHQQQQVKKRRKRRKLPDLLADSADSMDFITRQRRTSTPKDMHTDIESFIEQRMEEDSQATNSVQVLKIEHNGEEDDDEVFDSEDSNLTPPPQRPLSTGTFVVADEDEEGEGEVSKDQNGGGVEYIDSDDSRMLTPPPHRPDRYGPLGSSQTTTPTRDNPPTTLHTFSSAPRLPGGHNPFSHGIHHIKSPSRHRNRDRDHDGGEEGGGDDGLHHHHHHAVTGRIPNPSNPVWSRFLLDNVSLASQPNSRPRSPHNDYYNEHTKTSPEVNTTNNNRKHLHQDGNSEEEQQQFKTRQQQHKAMRYNGYNANARAPNHGYSNDAYTDEKERKPGHGLHNMYYE